jgi:GMP synthase (glutamine-hydrolysing)
LSAFVATRQNFPRRNFRHIFLDYGWRDRAILYSAGQKPMNSTGSMRTTLAITHVAFEDLGSLSMELTHAGFNIQAMDACTADLRAIDALEPDLLVVLGGPVGVYQRDAYPFLEVETQLLRSRLAAKRPTLGICLGAQLMAAALGARVYPGSNGKELGWAPIHTDSDCSLPAWFGPLLNSELRVLHWHGDTFDLPPGTARLARTAHYSNQAFAAGNYGLAVQFHPEVTVQGLERWYVGHANELSQSGVCIRHLREESRTFGPELETAARRFWQQWLDHVFNPIREP